MSDVRLTNEYRRERISFSCVLVSTVFFLVLFQAPILKVPEIVTQVFRPVIVFFLLIRMVQRGKIDFSARIIALIMAIYCIIDLMLTKINVDEIIRASAVCLYLLMFCAVTGTAWNKREIRFIVFACFLGTFACAIAIFASNNPTDLHVGTSGNMKMLGTYVNRNKNAYAFTTGTILGVIYLLYGKNIKKFWIAIMTAVIAYALLYSQCRGAFFCAIAGVLILLVSGLLRVKKRDEGKFLFYTLLLIVICIASYFLLKNSQLSRLIDGDTSGRDDGIQHAWQLFLNGGTFNKIFGFGYCFEGEHTDGCGAHLVYATYLLAIGLTGCTLLVLIFLCTASRIKGAVPYALFINAFLRTFFEGLDYYIYIPLILSLIIFNYTYIYRRSVNELFSGR